MRNLPFAFVQYNIFLLIRGLHKKVKKDKVDNKQEIKDKNFDSINKEN